MQLRHLWLENFRSYRAADIEFDDGLTVIEGANGAGKTNLVEAIAWLSTMDSFRGAPRDAMIRADAESAIIRGEVSTEGREILIEAELPRVGTRRVQANRQAVQRRSDLLEFLVVTVFSPDDLEIVKGGPSHRRDVLDDLLVDVHVKNDAAISEFDRVLRQRNALLKQINGRPDSAEELTLEVWDTRFIESGERLASLRSKLAERLRPLLADAYFTVAGREVDIGCHYVAEWTGDGLAVALDAARRDELRRGVTLVGPHRDDVSFTIDGLPTRTHASQGEQRSMVLALRLAAHRLVEIARGTPPVLLLDDVFSELDDARSGALLDALPEGQTIVTSATGPPPGTRPDRVIRIGSDGRVETVEGAT